MARPAELSRGEIWTVDFGEDIGQHHALLISRTGSIRRRWRAIVALVTSDGIGLPTEVPVGPEHGLEHDSVVDCEDVYTVSTELLTRRVGEVDPGTQEHVDHALRIALALQP